MGITKAAHSPFSSPVWPVGKPDGMWRMTVDYQELKKIIPPIHAVVPAVVDLMDRLTNELGIYHSVADLANAFFSIDIAPESRAVYFYLGRPAMDLYSAPSGVLAQPDHLIQACSRQPG